MEGEGQEEGSCPLVSTRQDLSSQGQDLGMRSTLQPGACSQGSVIPG